MIHQKNGISLLAMQHNRTELTKLRYINQASKCLHFFIYLSLKSCKIYLSFCFVIGVY
jgi:hypothetical protein